MRGAGERMTALATGEIATSVGVVRHQVAAGSAVPLTGWTSDAAPVSQIGVTTARVAAVSVEGPGVTMGTGAMAGVVTMDWGVPGDRDAMTRICSASAGVHREPTAVGALAPGHHACVAQGFYDVIVARCFSVGSAASFTRRDSA